ncbi:MAG: DUF3857 domain-containing protein [Flavobacteriaceae bacterium]|nr:DUF3857 domain-containing protein [Flavobacteriaceae bacterium]
MIKQITLLALLVVTSITFAQHYKTYDWESQPRLHELSEAEKKSSSVRILQYHIVEYATAASNGKLKIFETTHNITRVNDDKGIDRHNTVYIPMYGVNNVVDIKARTLNSEGKITELNKDNIKEVKNVETYGDFKIFAIEGVEKGSEIEVLYTVEKTYDRHGSQTIQSDFPIRKAEFLFITGKLNENIKAYRTINQFETTSVNGKNAKVLKLNAVPAMIKEEYATPNANKIEVVYQCFPKEQNITQDMFWNNVVTNVGSQLFPEKYPEIVKTDVTAIVKDLNAPTRFQIVNLVDDYIKTNFTVIKNNNPDLSNLEYILTNRTASEFGILKVYAHYLKALEIEYEVVLTANRFQFKFDPDFFNPNALRDFLIYIPQEKKYIAPGQIEYRLGEAPFNILGNYGVFISKNLEYYFSKIIQNDKNYSRTMRSSNISFGKDLEYVTLEQHHEYTGFWSVTNRAVLNLSTEQALKQFEDYLTGSGIEDKVILSYETKNTEMLQQTYNLPFIVNCKLQSEALLEDAGDSYIFQIGKVIGTQSELYQETDRLNPIEMTYPNQYDYTLTINIPEGYEAEGLESINIKKNYIAVNGTEIAKFESKYEQNGNQIIITIQEFYKTHEFDLHRYEEFRTVINAASDFNKAAILIKPKG